ncbi:MAG TPA: hypothetical protein VGF13_16165 [Verrucomicrobiae bacterium]|jgi:hypothetical protein
MKLIRLFLLSAGLILLLTGAAKLISASGNAGILGTADPVFHMPFKYLFRLVGTLELAVGAFCFLRQPLPLQASLVAGLASGFAAYRLALKWVNYQKPCSCLGTLTSALGISPDFAASLMTGLFWYLFFGSYVILLLSLKGSRTPAAQPAEGESFTNQ